MLNFLWRLLMYKRKRIFGCAVKVGARGASVTSVMGSLWMGKSYTRNLASPHNWQYVYQEDLDVSTKALWGFVDKLVAKLQAVKVWRWSHCPGVDPRPPSSGSTQVEQQDSFQTPKFDSL